MNSRDLMRSINEIDDELLIRSERAARPRRRVLYRIAAAAAALLFVFGAAFGIAKAANKGNSPYITEPKEAVLPPSQVGTEGVQHARIRAYSLSSALENSKAACIIVESPVWVFLM